MRKQQNVQKMKSLRGLGAWLPLSVSAVLAVTLATQCSLAGRQGARDTAGNPNVTTGSVQLQTTLGAAGMTAAAVIQNGVQAGVWSVDDSVWSFENCEVSASQLTSEMRQPPLGKRVESAAAEHLALLDLIPVERATVENIEALTIRSIDFGTVRASLCYRQANDQQFMLSAKVAHQVNAEQWQVITLKPRMADSSKLDHLLPLSGAISGVCQRVGRTGQLQCEIFETNSSMGGLLRAWQSAGWLVQDFGTTEPAEMNLLCCKGNQSIQVRATQHVSDAKTTVVLTALHNL